MQLRVRALETVLAEKGYIDPAALDLIVDAYETRIGPQNGARVVARAWTDASFKGQLLADGSAAVRSLGYENNVGDHLVVVENTDRVHNMVVCTLCSCYPWEMLGLPPIWYKSAPYRSRAVKDPRGVLRDFGLALPQTTEIRPGTYVFYDASSLENRLCDEADCALRVLTTVVSTAARRQCVIDAGSKTLSSDQTVGSGTYGHFIERPWTVRKLNEEHGYVEIHGPARVGEKVWLVPSHVCPTVNLHDEVWYGRDGRVEGSWKVAARGKVR